MSPWQSNLFNNLLVVFILVGLALVLYLRITKKTLPEVIKEVKEAMTPIDAVE